MQGHLGETRSVLRREYLLHAPDAWVRTPLAEVSRGMVMIHCSPRLGANFLHYTVELEAASEMMPCTEAGVQRFVWVLTGQVQIGANILGAGEYGYLPAEFGSGIRSATGASLSVIEKKYDGLAGVAAPGALFGVESEVPAAALGGDPQVMVRSLLPGDIGFDFAVNTMTYQPGAALSQVEIHVMEHGLVMLEGAGTYRLGEERYEVRAGDFIWMAPYCPQWFVAEGDVPAKYLIYKDWNRRPRL